MDSVSLKFSYLNIGFYIKFSPFILQIRQTDKGLLWKHDAHFSNAAHSYRKSQYLLPINNRHTHMLPSCISIISYRTCSVISIQYQPTSFRFALPMICFRFSLSKLHEIPNMTTYWPLLLSKCICYSQKIKAYLAMSICYIQTYIYI